MGSFTTNKQFFLLKGFFFNQVFSFLNPACPKPVSSVAQIDKVHFQLITVYPKIIINLQETQAALMRKKKQLPPLLVTLQLVHFRSTHTAATRNDSH